KATGPDPGPLLGNPRGRIRGAQLPPQSLGLAGRGVHQAGHPLVPAATAARIGDAERVLQDAARRGLAAPKSEGDTLLDAVGFPRGRLEMLAEHLEHEPRIAGGLELREIRVRREPVHGNRRRERLFSHGYGLLYQGARVAAGCCRSSVYSCRYRAFPASSSACVPRPMTRPSSSTRTTS